MPLKPRLVLATLLTASLFGVYLSWASAPVSIVGPVASWVAVVSLGTVLTAGVLWLRYSAGGETGPGWLARRWVRLLYVAGSAAVAGVCVRLAHAGVVMTLPDSPLVSLGVGVVVFGVFVAGVRRFGLERAPRGAVVVGSAGAVVGLVGLAWVNVGMSGGTLAETVVRAVHLVVAGAWVGGAIWHNTVVVAAREGPAGTGVKRVLRGFQRVVPLFIAAILGTGLHQATTWLGTSPSTYLSTSVGRVVALKLVAVLVLASVFARSLLKRRSTAASAAGNAS